MDWLSRRFNLFAAWMVAYFLAYIAVAISIRYLSYFFSIIEIAAIRSAGSLAIAAFLVFRSAQIRRQLPGLGLRHHILRSVIHLCGSLALIWSVANLPLGFIATVEFSGPLFAALIGFVVFRRLPHSTAMLGLALIAIGSAYLLLAQGVAQDARLLVPLVAVGLLTVTNLMLARLAETKNVMLIVLVMHCVQLPLYAAIFLLSPNRTELGDLHGFDVDTKLGLAVAAFVLMIAGFVTQTALASASRYGSALQLCAADTLRVPFLTIIGFVVFSEMLDPRLLLPGALVVAGAIVVSLPRRSVEALRPS
jgi:drug/metabolite transporter (DMT)-like permease